jgi:hypothetical protein
MARQQVRWGGLVVCVCAWLLVAGAQDVHAETIVIDNFDVPDLGTPFVIPFLDAAPWNHTDTTGDGGILGQEREVLIDVAGPLDSQPIVATGVVGVDMNSVVGMLSFGSQDDLGSIVMLTYDGPGQDGLGAVDLTDGGTNTGFQFHFTSLNAVKPDGLDVDIAAISSLGEVFGYSGRIASSAAAFDFDVAFDDFTVLVGDPQSASFSAIDSLTFLFNGDGTPAVDFSLDMIAAVPEPCTLFLLGLGLFLLVAREGCRRRTR